MSNDNAAVLNRFFSSFSAGDMDGAFELLAPDIVWTYYGPQDKIPFAGVFTGHAGVRLFFDEVEKSIELKAMTPVSMESIGERVYGRGVEHSRVIATGKEYRVEWAHVYTVRDGKIATFEEFLDSAAVCAAFSF